MADGNKGNNCAKSCADCSKRGECPSENQLFKLGEHSSVKRVIAVTSGKGGVGKSTVAVLLARALSINYKVGIIDADVTGPSIPYLLNMRSEIVAKSEHGMLPAVSPDGIKALSVNFMLSDENRPLVWRAPVVSGVIKQFWSDACWGDLDYMIIDMPPGTGDVAITVMRSLPVDAAIVVATPHDLVNIIVNKCLGMCDKLGVKVMGIVENMSHIICPDCGKIIEPFKGSTDKNYTPLVRLPITSELSPDMLNPVIDLLLQI